MAHRQAYTFLCLTTKICTPLVLSIYFNKAIMNSLTTLMCHFEFYGYFNLARQSRPPFLLRFLEQALSPVPPNACTRSALYAMSDRQVPPGLTCLRLRVHRSRTSHSDHMANQGRTNFSG
jgi:hypothetical protein